MAAIYLDNAATTYPKPDCVIDAVAGFMKDIGVSTGRGAYRRALDADAMVYEARKTIARLFGVLPSRVVFTPGVTWALNLALKGLVPPTGRVVTTAIEHNAVWRPLCALRARGVSVSTVAPDPDGVVSVADMIAAIGPDTSLVTMIHASNVTGAIQPVAEVAQHCRSLGVPLLIDAAQTAGCLPMDSLGLGDCLIAFAGHKSLLGPQGTGGLFVPTGCGLTPLIEGGTGEDSRSETQPESLPERLESGTPNLPGIVGLAAGAGWVQQRGVDAIRSHERELSAYTRDALAQIPGITVHGPTDADKRVGVLSFSVPGTPPGDVAYLLDRDWGIMVRAGLHCSPCCHRALGTDAEGTVRIGIGPFTTVADIDALADALSTIVGGR